MLSLAPHNITSASAFFTTARFATRVLAASGVLVLTVRQTALIISPNAAIVMGQTL